MGACLLVCLRCCLSVLICFYWLFALDLVVCWLLGFVIFGFCWFGDWSLTACGLRFVVYVCMHTGCVGVFGTLGWLFVFRLVTLVCLVLMI